MGDTFIKLSKGHVLNISCIESLGISKYIADTTTETTQYKNLLEIRTKSKNVYYEDESVLDTILKYIDVVNSIENECREKAEL